MATQDFTLDDMSWSLIVGPGHWDIFVISTGVALVRVATSPPPATTNNGPALTFERPVPKKVATGESLYARAAKGAVKLAVDAA